MLHSNIWKYLGVELISARVKMFPISVDRIEKISAFNQNIKLSLKTFYIRKVLFVYPSALVWWKLYNRIEIVFS